MSRLHLVRHGPTHAKAMVGWTDLPADLSDTDYLARLADHLPRDAVVISSDLIRAAHTADAIQRDRTRLPHEPGLREINFGDWEMRRFAEIDAEDPERIRAYWQTPGETAPPNGESWNSVCARVNRTVDRLITSHPDQDIVIVAHFGVILTQLQRALNIPAARTFSHKIDNLALTEVTRRPDGWEIGLINHIL